jgi:hypothetical protein
MQPVYKVPVTIARGEPMQSPEDVAAMLRLHECGWGAKRIARELGISKNTVKRYLREGGWTPYAAPQRAKALDGVGGLAQGAVSPSPRQRGGGAARAESRACDHGEPADGGAGLGTVSTGTGGRGAGDGAL